MSRRFFGGTLTRSDDTASTWIVFENRREAHADLLNGGFRLDLATTRSQPFVAAFDSPPSPAISSIPQPQGEACYRRSARIQNTWIAALRLLLRAVRQPRSCPRSLQTSPACGRVYVTAVHARRTARSIKRLKELVATILRAYSPSVRFRKHLLL